MEKENNIFIINYFWTHSNFGAVLTAYALQNIIPQKYSSTLLNTEYSLYLATTKKNKNINNFKKQHLISSDNKYLNLKDFKTLENKCQTYITGSDQVFRNASNSVYLLDFV